MKARSQALAMLIVLLMAGCRTYHTTIDNQNIASIYNPSSTYLHPDYNVYHKDDSISMLLVKFYPAELLFNQANKTKSFKAKLQIHYKLYPSFENNTIIDSATVQYLIDRNSIGEEVTSYIEFTTPKPRKYVLRVTTTDLLRNNSAHTFIIVDKTDDKNQQNFSLLRSDKSVYFDKHVRNDELYLVEYHRHFVDTLYQGIRKAEFPLALPPFSSKKPPLPFFRADTIVAYQYNDSLGFVFNQKALYHFNIDTSQYEGLAVNHFSNQYPLIRTPRQMVYPLRYLTTNEEYKKMIRHRNMKLAVDNFWLSTTDNMLRAKELIRVYYNRVTYANVYFTSVTEGWRTDRGMIFTVLGPPGSVYKDDKQEKWIYGENRNVKPVTFVFHKIKSPYTDNHYILQRSQKYHSVWNDAITAWRKGRPYSFMN